MPVGRFFRFVSSRRLHYLSGARAVRSHIPALLIYLFHFLPLCFFLPQYSQEGGLPLLLCLAQAPPRAQSSALSVSDSMGVEPSVLSSSSASASAGGGWEVFASAVRLLRRACMLAANRSDLLALKVSQTNARERET